MTLNTLVSAGIMALMASTAMSQTLDPVRVEMFRSILKGNECVLTEAAAGNILPRFDFTKEETRAIVGALVAAGEVRLDGSTLNLIDGSCEAEDPVAALLGQRNVQQFIAVMAENSCAMNEADAEPIFTERGISKSQVGAVVGPMIQAGMATFEGGVLTVDAAYCSPVVVEAEAATAPMEVPELDRSGMFGLGRVRGLVDAMAQNNCMLNMEVADGYLAGAGIEHSFAQFIGRKMLKDGYATMVDDENLVLSAPYCVPAAGAAPVMAAETPPAEDRGVDTAMVATLREIFLANNCRLNEDQMSALLPPAGFTRDNIKPIFGYLEGMGEMGEDGSDLVLYNAACAPALAEEPPVEDAGVDMAQVDLMRQIFAENGCRLSEARMGELLPAAGFSRASAGAVFNYLEANGELSDVDNDAVLTGDYCAEAQAEPATAPVMVENDGTPKGAMLATAAQSGCALNVEADAERLAQAGVRMDQAFRIVDDLVASGDASLSDGGTVVSINPVLCGSEMQPVEPVAQPVEAAEAAVEATNAPVENSDDPRAAVLAMLAANGCEVTQADAADMVAAAGLDFNTSMQILTQMMGTGEATSPDGGQTLQVSAPLCVAVGAEPMTPRAAFINLIKQNNCSVTAAEFSALLPVDGLDAPTAFAMISELEAEGVISLPATRDVVTLSAEMCR